MDSTQADPAGFKPSSLLRLLSLLAGWPSYLIFTTLLLRLCWYGRLPSLPWDSLFLYFLWIACLVIWLAVRIAVWFSERPQAGAKRRLGGAIMLVCFMFILAFVVPLSRMLCRISFEANRPAFDRLAREALAPPSLSDIEVFTRDDYISRTNNRARSIGVYEIESVEYRRIASNDPEEVIVYLAPFNRHEGFVYCPKCRSDDPFHPINLGDGWYTFAQYSQ